MDKIATLAPAQRAELFRETGNRMGLPAALVEKDFWVCWTLRHVFAIEALRGNILFKGGTSLSKIFHAIRRFSEDIDLAINYEMLGFTGPRHPANAPSRNKRQELLGQMLIACRAYVQGDFLKLLTGQFAGVLGASNAWQLRTQPSEPNSAVVEFVYPPCLSTTESIAYVRPMVILEPGTHAEFMPRGRYPIKPFAAEHFPNLFAAPYCEVEALTAERTFWEKATILHAEHHRPAEKQIQGRHSRHYYDTAMMAQSPIKTRALADRELLARVVHHKNEFYYSKWARYDLAVPGTFRLVPPEPRLVELRRDYQSMSVMIFGEVPAFESILDTLRRLEAEINALA